MVDSTALLMYNSYYIGDYMKKIFDELNQENGSNYKLKVLKQYKDNVLLQRVLKLIYDKVQYTYGMSLKAVKAFPVSDSSSVTFEQALDILENQIVTREITGNTALRVVSNLIAGLSDDDGYIIEKIIERNARCNFGTTQINKVWKGLITKQLYMRCGVYGDKTKKKIKFPAYIQLKADGTYREFTVKDGTVTAKSRSAETYDYPIHFELMKNLPNGHYTGELTVAGITDRSQGNGLINSSTPPHEQIIFQIWDYITDTEYANAGNKIKNSIIYSERFEELIHILEEIPSNQGLKHIQVIPSTIVNSLSEALEITSHWMTQGFEGAVLKNSNGLFKDGTSTDQLKLKICIEIEVRIIDFAPGKVGSKREGKVGAIIFRNDENTIRGRCSGFSDDILNKMTEHPEDYINQIISVEFNDLSKAENNDFYALSHPRFIEFRTDKTETDTLERTLELREMAMQLGEKNV